MEIKELRSNIRATLDRAAALWRQRRELDCAAAQELMSPFIDSMTTHEEMEQLEIHTSNCEPCRRQLQSFISLRSLLGRAERPDPPEDLVLESRVKLSHERNRNYLEQLETRVTNILKPIAIPAFFGVSLTMLFFGVLLGSLVSNTTVMANDRAANDTVFSLYKPVRTTNPTMVRFAVSDNNWDEPLTIETHVGVDGRVIDYQIISGPQGPAVNRWVRELLYYAQFTPATAFGKPIDSRIILSFVAVRS
jgi:hypothetical protein